MPFQFLALPIELKVKILEFLLVNAENVDSEPATIFRDVCRMKYDPFPRDYGLWTESHHTKIKTHPAIMSTCRFCADEGRKILYRQNRFHISDIGHFLGPLISGRTYDTQQWPPLDWRNERFLKPWEEIRHVSVELPSLMGDNERSTQRVNISILATTVFPELESLHLIMSTVIPGLGNLCRRVLLAIALDVFENLSFRTAVYQNRDVQYIEKSKHLNGSHIAVTDKRLIQYKNLRHYDNLRGLFAFRPPSNSIAHDILVSDMLNFARESTKERILDRCNNLGGGASPDRGGQADQISNILDRCVSLSGVSSDSS
ncbi:MAG: hypothetical protein Q9160_008396 [Pyrenula sp. 1 TL-2023]